MLQYQVTPEIRNPKDWDARPASIHLHTPKRISTSIVNEDDPDRAELEKFIRDIFYRAHGANIDQFLPHMISLRNDENTLLAACGFRSAEKTPLFLEYYLDESVEKLISSRSEKPVNRRNILEIGNLALAKPAHIRVLLASLNRYLHGTDTEWVVFTGITTLFNSMKKLNMPMHILGKADIERLPLEQQSAWGSYYREKPQVIAIPRFQSI